MPSRIHRNRTGSSSVESLALIGLVILSLLACVLIWREPILETNAKFVHRAKSLLLGGDSPQQGKS